MKLIKHLINIMFLWSIPFILLGMFLLLTGLSFSYRAAVGSTLWISVNFFYCLLTLIIYTISVGETDEMSILK